MHCYIERPKDNRNIFMQELQMQQQKYCMYKYLNYTGCKILNVHILVLKNYRNNWSILMVLVANKNLNSEYFVYVSMIPPNAS